MSNTFLEDNEYRLKELAKRSGQEREKFLIDLINRITEEKNEILAKLRQIVWKDDESYNY